MAGHLQSSPVNPVMINPSFGFSGIGDYYNVFLGLLILVVKCLRLFILLLFRGAEL